MKILNKNLEELKKKDKKRVGRGISAGGGKTAGRGTKGQKSRAGHNIPRQFEGGQSNLSLRLPKVRGFKKPAQPIVEISLTLLDKTFKANDIINRESLLQAGLINPGQTEKILANGEITKALVLEEVNISKSARALIEGFKPAKAEKPAAEAEAEEETPKASKPAAKKASDKAKASK